MIRPTDLLPRLGLVLALALVLPVVAWAQRPPAIAERAYADAYDLYATQLYEPAIQAFGTFRRQYPNHLNVAEAYYYEAAANLALGRDDEAVRLFRRFQQRYPTHPLGYEARLALGTYYYETEDYDQAIATLREIVDEDPPMEIGAKALYWMGEAAFNQGDLNRALAYYQQSAEQYRASSVADAALYAIAYTQVRLERVDEAVRSFEVLGARYPDSPYARTIGLALAELYYELADYPRTITEIERRMPALAPAAQERATFLLAESHNQLRNSPEAIRAYRRFTEDNPDSPYYRNALYGLAFNYFAESSFQWAADNFAQVHQGASDNLAAQALYYEAVSLQQAEQPREALARYEEATARFPQGPMADHATHERGLLLYELRRWEDAASAFQALIDTYPSSDLLGEALRMRGYAAVALGDFTTALRVFDRAIAEDAAAPALRREVQFQKAWLLYQQERYAEAEEAFATLYQADPTGAKADESLFWQAESAFQQDALERATRLIGQYLQAFPGGRQVDAAQYVLGWSYFRQARYAEAAQAFERFLQTYQEAGAFVPYRTDARLRLADSYFAQRRYPEAIQAYARVGEEGQDYALYQIGQALYSTGDAFEAASTFRDLLDQYPESTWREEARYQLGYLFFLNEDYDGAIDQYQTLIRTAPRDVLVPKAQYGIGDALFNAGRLEEAVTAYQQVMERYPSSPFAVDAALGIQYALLALDDVEQAEALVQDFIAQNPDSPVVEELRFRLAEAKYQSGRQAEALADFEAFVDGSSNDALVPEAYYYLGTIYAGRGQAQAAEPYLRQLITQYPGSTRAPDAARTLGEQYLEQGRYADALALYRSMVEMQPDDARLVAVARYGQGTALLELGRVDEADQLLRAAVEAAPDAPESLPALLGLARVEARQGNTRAALQRFRTVIQRSRDEVGAEALYRLGELLLNDGSPQVAVDELSRLPTLYAGYDTWIAQGYLLQADAHLRLGQKGEAARLYDEVIFNFAGTPFAERAERSKATL